MKDQQHAHALLDQIPANQLATAVRFLEFLLLDPVSRTIATAPPEAEEITEEEDRAVARSKEWFKNNPETPFGEVVNDLGFTMDQIRDHQDPD